MMSVSENKGEFQSYVSSSADTSLTAKSLQIMACGQLFLAIQLMFRARYITSFLPHTPNLLVRIKYISSVTIMCIYLTHFCPTCYLTHQVPYPIRCQSHLCNARNPNINRVVHNVPGPQCLKCEGEKVFAAQWQAKARMRKDERGVLIHY